MKRVAISFVVIALGYASLTLSAECSGLEAFKNSGAPSLTANLAGLVGRSPDHARPNCASLIAVLSRIADRQKTGGRRLEPDKPLDPREAQANITKATRDPAINARLRQVQGEVKDERLRLLYEAAIFDEEGYYSARDLRLQQLQPQAR